jgi:hypothetical protein
MFHGENGGVKLRAKWRPTKKLCNPWSLFGGPRQLQNIGSNDPHSDQTTHLSEISTGEQAQEFLTGIFEDFCHFLGSVRLVWVA